MRIIQSLTSSMQAATKWTSSGVTKNTKKTFKLLPSKGKKHPYSKRVETKACMMKQYYKANTLLSQMMQIFNEKYKTLLINNKEDEVTKITITTIKYDADKSPRRFPSRDLPAQI